MNWYYAHGEERSGPCTEEQFQALVRQGVVTPQTLVWREGMANWQPHAEINAPPRVAGPLSENYDVKCAACGKTFPVSEVVTLANRDYCAACKPLAVQRLKEGVAPSAQSEEIRRQYLTHEASVKSVGLLYYFGGVGLFLGGLSGIVIAAASASGAEAIGQATGRSVFFLALGIGQFWVGRGLRGLKSWARLPVGILSGLGLLAVPIGTLINAYVLYLIFSKKGKMVFSDEYREVMEQTPHIKYRTSILVWVLLGLVVALIGFVLIAAYLKRR